MAEGEPPYIRLPQGKALFLISTQGAPPLKKPKMWSADFKHFLSLCLTKDARTRPKAIELLQHPFLRVACTPEQFATEVIQKGRRQPTESVGPTECLIS